MILSHHICSRNQTQQNQRAASTPNYCLSQGFLVFWENTKTKEGKGLFDYEFQFAVHQWGMYGQELKRDRNLEVETDAEDKEGCCLLACFPCLAQSVFFWKQEWPVQGWPHSPWTRPSLIDHQLRNALHLGLMKAFLQSRLPSLQWL